MILIIEPDESRRNNLLSLLSGKSGTPTAVASFQEAEEILKKEKITVLILGTDSETAESIGEKTGFHGTVLFTSQLAEQKQSYEKNLEAMVRDSVADLVRLNQRILRIQEEERSRLSQEIHDDLGQSLLALKLQIQSTAAGLREDEAGRFDETLEYLKEIIHKSRVMAHDLSPVGLRSLGLSRAIDEMSANLKKVSGVRIHTDCRDLDQFFRDGWNIDVYRIIQELTSNIIKHAAASQADIIAERMPAGLRLTVRDDGSGFRKSENQKPSSGLGLTIVQKRVDLLGAAMSIRSESENGTEIIIEIPEYSSGRRS